MITIDQIVRSVLWNKGHTIHRYFQYAKYALDCITELHFDTLRVVNTSLLDVNSYGAIKVPSGYLDWVRIGAGVAQISYGLNQYPGIKNLTNKDENGYSVPYGVDLVKQYYNADFWYDNYNVRGIDSSTNFGARASGYWTGFKDLSQERGEIQLSEGFCGKQATLEWISDGSACNTLTRVTPYAKKTVEDYIEWQSSPNRNNNRSAEGQKYFRSLEILRARMDPMTYEDLIMCVESARFQAIK